ncbi:ester cyclase [Nocardia sp. NPDC058379]|uniref:ester cyclase n=1 Tax=unclassified Nocardia TaxID=2637762 RepID=UPI00365BB606
MTEALGPAAVTAAIIQARAAGDLDAALGYIAAESWDQGKKVTHDDWRAKWQSMFAGAPDLDVTTETTVEHGDWVAHRYTVRGTHTGEFLGLSATGLPFETVGMDMIRTDNGKLVEHWMVAEPFPEPGESR